MGNIGRSVCCTHRLGPMSIWNSSTWWIDIVGVSRIETKQVYSLILGPLIMFMVLRMGPVFLGSQSRVPNPVSISEIKTCGHHFGSNKCHMCCGPSRSPKANEGAALTPLGYHGYPNQVGIARISWTGGLL